MQLNAMVGLDSVDFVSISNRNILVKGVSRVFEFCNRNKVGFWVRIQPSTNDVYLVVVVVFCEMSSLVSEKTNSIKISIFAYFRLFNKYKTQ